MLPVDFSSAFNTIISSALSKQSGPPGLQHHSVSLAPWLPLQLAKVNACGKYHPEHRRPSNLRPESAAVQPDNPCLCYQVHYKPHHQIHQLHNSSEPHPRTTMSRPGENRWSSWCSACGKNNLILIVDKSKESSLTSGRTSLLETQQCGGGIREYLEHKIKTRNISFWQRTPWTFQNPCILHLVNIETLMTICTFAHCGPP